jgi:hypothetical protein
MLIDIAPTFEIVRQRQVFLRLLAGPQPLIPFHESALDAIRKRLRQMFARLQPLAGHRHVAEPDVQVTP